MKIKPFELERYFAKYEFTTKYLLSSSECQALTLKELLDIADAEMLGMYENLGLGYTQSSGHPMLIEEIKQLYENASEENILTLAPQEGIFIAMNVMLDKDDHVVCTHPGYQSLYEVGNSIGCDVSYWKVQYNSEGAYFDVDEMESLIKDSTKAIVINSPHNPTGYMPSYDEYMRIFDIARKHGIWVISDEMYRFLERGGQETLPFACDVYEKAVSLFGLSKSLALPGLRIGWLCSQDVPLMDECKRYRDYLTICSAAPSEVLAIIALKAKDRIIKKNKAIIDDNLKLLDGFMHENEDRFEYYKPIAGSICYPRLKGKVKIKEFCEDLAQNGEVMLLPCNVYGEDNNRFRLGYGKKDFQTAIEALGKFLKAD